ncbi:MAG: Trp biosynthesis-associated membrane protein [Nocardioides sp.]
MADLRFGRTVTAGVILAAVSVFGATRSWATIEVRPGLVSTSLVAGLEQASPLTGSLNLVALTTWGTFLVSRTRLRRIVAYAGALAAAGAVGGQVWWLTQFESHVHAMFDSARLDSVGTVRYQSGIHPWFWVTLLSSVGVVIIGVVAARAASGWPEMGRRYDAPGSPPRQVGDDLTSPAQVWRALDEGRDPTDSAAT